MFLIARGYVNIILLADRVPNSHGGGSITITKKTVFTILTTPTREVLIHMKRKSQAGHTALLPFIRLINSRRISFFCQIVKIISLELRLMIG